MISYSREYDGQTVLIVNNLSAFAQPAELDLHPFVGAVPVELLGNHEFPRIGERPYFLSLAPHSFYWFRLDRQQETEVVLTAGAVDTTRPLPKAE